MKKRNAIRTIARYKTNQVCDSFDISKATLFRWERRGLITGPPRDWRNWRPYTKEKENVAEIQKMIRARKIVM